MFYIFMKIRRVIFFLWFLFFVSGFGILSAEESTQHKGLPRLLFFYSESCHACQKTKKEVMPSIQKEFSGKVNFEYLNIADVNNYKFLLTLLQKNNITGVTVPAVFLEGRFVFGYEKIKKEMRVAILEVLQKRRLSFLGELATVDLTKHFRSFSIIAIISAGLVDGINPCAFTAIVFFISFLAVQGYRRRQLAAIGGVFILAVFLTYVLIGLGIFRFLYALAHFYWLTKVIYYLIAFLCFVLGGVALYDFWLYKKTNATDGMILQLPTLIKNKIHALVGAHYRRGRDKENLDTSRNSSVHFILGAFVVGFLVSLLEAVCTGQLYLPTIAFVLKDASLRLRALWFLLMYNLMFIVPLLIVLLLALLGTTSEGFSRFLKKHMLLIKALMALLFFGLGIFIFLGA